MRTITLLLTSLLLLPASILQAASFTFQSADGEPLPMVMVTRTPPFSSPANIDQLGYVANGESAVASTALTRFSNVNGEVSFNDNDQPASYRARAQGYQDLYFDGSEATLVMQPMNEQQLLDSYPSNVWLSQLHFGGDAKLKKNFQLNCAFCHQQASPFMRNERTTEQWVSVFERMNSYGARLPDEDHQRIAEILQQEYRALREDPSSVPAPARWQAHLPQIEMTEWPIGDGFSQMHDFLLHPNGKIYVGDNLFDRIYEIDPVSGEYSVYVVPHPDDAQLGGILGNRFITFPKMANYMGVHSFAYSKKDGHIFITPSMQQALLEFDPVSKKFTTHWMDEGYYPHTIRVDDKDRVWFTLAVSSQVAMFDRTNNRFKLFDLPARTFKEWLTIKLLPLVFWFDPDNRPTPAPDRDGNGLPMPYGIDIAPDGTVWVARLYANDLARIDPESGEVTMIDFPFEGPRRLRADADGNLWIVAFQDSLLVKYDPAADQFTRYELPVVNELPYALNVDRQRGVVWVNGNQSDTLLSFNIASEQWQVYPMPRQRFFTRDVEISEEDGSVYTSNSHFPTWQSEGAMPTLLRISPLSTAQEEQP